MSWLGLLISVAIAEESLPITEEVTNNPPAALTDTDETLYKRLLEDNEPRKTELPATQTEVTELGFPWWGYPLGLFAMLGLGYTVKRQGIGLRSTAKIKVLSRATLGREGSLAVVEVPTTDGELSRMLIGYGAGSAPRLVAELGQGNDNSLDASSYTPLNMVIDDDDVLSDRENMINDVLAARKQTNRPPSKSAPVKSDSNEDPWVRDFQRLLAEHLKEDDPSA